AVRILWRQVLRCRLDRRLVGSKVQRATGQLFGQLRYHFTRGRVGGRRVLGLVGHSKLVVVRLQVLFVVVDVGRLEVLVPLAVEESGLFLFLVVDEPFKSVEVMTKPAGWFEMDADLVLVGMVDHL